MITKIFNTKKYYKKNILKLKEEIIKKTNKKKRPKISILITNNNYDTNLYLKNKIIACKKIKMNFIIFKLIKNIKTKEIINIINNINKNKLINGLLIETPIPKKIKEKNILKYINKKKDLDCLNPNNFNNYIKNQKTFIKPCITHAIEIFLKKKKINIKGLYGKIIGFSNTVGKPIIQMLNKNGMNAAIINKYNKKTYEKNNDIIITALGKKFFDNKNKINGCIIIDIGINKTQNGNVKGDTNSQLIINYVNYLISVPNGIGLLTILNLLKNNFNLFLFQNKIKKT